LFFQARLSDELAANSKESTDLKEKLGEKTKQLEQTLADNEQLQTSIKQQELEMAKNNENANRKLAALQQELDAAATQHSTDLTNLQAQLDAKNAELQAAIEKSASADAQHQAELKLLQTRIAKFDSRIQEKDKKIGDLLKSRNDRYGSDNSINVVVPETESVGSQPKEVGFGSLQPLMLNLPPSDSFDDDFGFVSEIGMQDDGNNTDFESISGRSTVDEPIKKKTRSSFPPVVRKNWKSRNTDFLIFAFFFSQPGQSGTVSWSQEKDEG
jgi:hypothetical protein